AKLKRESRLFKSVKLTWTPHLIEVLQSYKYDPEENARPIKAKVKAMVLKPLTDLIRSGTIQSRGESIEMNLDIFDNPDKTKTLKVEVKDQSGKTFSFNQPISVTLSDKPAVPILDERIDEVAKSEDKINSE